MTSTQTMWAFQQQKRFIDLVVHIDDATYECHKLVLASVPGYFRDLFCLDFQETTRDEIEIRVPNASNAFAAILRYLYTGDLSVVTAQNAMAVHIQAVYFRLSELRAAAEAVFARLDRASGLQLLQQVAAAPVPFLPAQIVELLAQSFPQLHAHALFAELPRPLLHQVLAHPRLRIASDRQLLDFIGVLHQKRALTGDEAARCRALVRWEFLSEGDWEAADWPLLVDADVRARMLELRRARGGADPALANVLVALAADDVRAGIASLLRYHPPLIEPFDHADNFFDNPARFHVNEKLLKKQTQITVAMTGRAGLYLTALSAVLSAWRNTSMLSIVLEPIGATRIEQTASPENVDGTAVFNVRFEDRRPVNRVVLTFIVQDEKRFALSSITAQGFVFVH